MRIVVPFLGSKVPRYVFSNLARLKQTFPENQVIFLSNNVRALQSASKQGIAIWKTSDLREKIEVLLSGKGVNLNFRDGFWSYTVGRFLAIREFMSVNPMTSVLLVEADVRLASNFPLQEIQSIDKEIAFPVTQRAIGVPSTLYLKNEIAADFLWSFSIECFQIRNLYSDVEILGKMLEVHPEKVFVLPSGFPNDLAFNESADLELRNLITSGLPLLGGIFDGSTWGQYLLGDDPANRFGLSLVNQNQDHQAVNPSNLKFRTNGGRIIVSSGKVEWPIYSLHVHSKRNKFLSANSNQTIEQMLLRASPIPRKYFYLDVFLHPYGLSALGSKILAKVKRQMRIFLFERS